MATVTFYAPTFIDFSLTAPNKHGLQKPTGNLSGCVVTRTFKSTKNGGVKASRGVISFSWKGDTQESKANALAKAIEGMDELEGLDSNTNLSWIPQIVKEKLK